MSRHRSDIKNWLEYAYLRCVHSIVAALPWGAARSAGRVIADLIRLLDRPSRKRNVARNLRHAFPEMSEVEIRKTIRDVYRNLVESVVDAVNFIRLANGEDVQDLLEVHGMDKLEGRDGRVGVVFVTGHLGCWELLGVASSRIGYPVTSVARPFDNPLLYAYACKLRESTGQSIVPHKGSMRSVMRLLRRGGNVGFLIDRDARRHGIFVDFFGRPASTIASPARVALHTGAPVAFIYCMRIGKTNRFRIVLSDVVWPRPGADKKQETVRITQRITKDLEEVIRKEPSRWLWLHKRWRTYPGKYD